MFNVFAAANNIQLSVWKRSAVQSFGTCPENVIEKYCIAEKLERLKYLIMTPLYKPIINLILVYSQNCVTCQNGQTIEILTGIPEICRQMT